MEQCGYEKCKWHVDYSKEPSCRKFIKPTMCPDHEPLKANKEPVAEVPCSDRVMCADCKYWDMKDSIRARFGACTNKEVNEVTDPFATYQAQTREDFGCILAEST